MEVGWRAPWQKEAAFSDCQRPWARSRTYRGLHFLSYAMEMTVSPCNWEDGYQCPVVDGRHRYLVNEPARQGAQGVGAG